MLGHQGGPPTERPDHGTGPTTHVCARRTCLQKLHPKCTHMLQAEPTVGHILQNPMASSAVTLGGGHCRVAWTSGMGTKPAESVTGAPKMQQNPHILSHHVPTICAAGISGA